MVLLLTLHIYMQSNENTPAFCQQCVSLSAAVSHLGQWLLCDSVAILPRGQQTSVVVKLSSAVLCAVQKDETRFQLLIVYTCM